MDVIQQIIIPNVAMWLVVQHSADDRLKQIWLAEFDTWICERYDWWFSNSADGEPN